MTTPAHAYADRGVSRPGRRGRVPGLDGCRALAVGVVIAYHAGAPIPGDLGVQFFFVVSGYLITSLLLAEHATTGRIDLRAFYMRRTLRIVPAYVAFLALSFAIDSYLGDRWPWGLRLAAATYTVNYYNALNGHQAMSIGHAWSLAVEEQFYLLWPLALVALLRARRSAPVVLCGAILVVCAWRAYAFVALHSGTAYVYNAFETRFDSLAIGCLVAVTAGAPRAARYRTLVAGSWWAPLPVLVLIAMSRLGPRTYHYTLGFTVDAALMAVFLVQVVQLSRTFAWSWLEGRIIRYLGAISYPLYLYHMWGLAVGRHVGGFPVGIAAAIWLASASYFVIERPFLAMKTRWVRAVSSEGTPPAQTRPSARTAPAAANFPDVRTART